MSIQIFNILCEKRRLIFDNSVNDVRKKSDQKENKINEISVFLGLLLIASLAHRVNARCDDDDNNTNVDDSDYYKPRCGLTEIPKTIPPSTQNLDLSYNVIATIPIGVFSSLTQCEDLSLSNNRLTVLTQGCLQVRRC